MKRPDLRDVDTLANCILLVLVGIIFVTCIGLSFQRAVAPLPTPVEVVEPVEDGLIFGTPTVIGEYHHPTVGSRPRSPHWPTFRAEQIEKRGGKCEACGTTHDLNLHHIQSFHDRPDLELDASNVLILCRDLKHGRNCHFEVGHDPDFDGPLNPNWSTTNPNVVRDAERMRKKLKP